MKRPRPPRRSPPRQSPPVRGRSAAAARPETRLTGWRRWVFPLVTALVVPALLFGVLEGGLRLLGYGAPSAFLLPIGDDTLVTNPRFGWRFFPPAIARAPVVERLAVEKPAEVVNAAMAAVDSHVVRVIGRELAGHRSDAFLLYLGNNEAVGPHGPGTVFGGYSSSLPALRARIWLQGTRTGQLLRDVTGSLAGGQRRGELGRWRGMEMFLERQVPADDPRLAVERAIRRVARQRAADGVMLVEGAARVAGVEPGEPPLAGHDVLWEHVHLTPEGLARAFFDALAPWLAGGAAVPEPPGPTQTIPQI